MTHQVQSQFKQAMRRLAANVSLISCNVDEQKAGIAATAICSLSMDPPSLVACVNHDASIHRGLNIGDLYCINLLKSGQQELSNVFGNIIQCPDKFAYGEWSQDADDIPYLLDAQASVFCSVDKIINHGTHSIIIGNVTRVLINEIDAPLIYFNGGYL